LQKIPYHYGLSLSFSSCSHILIYMKISKSFSYSLILFLLVSYFFLADFQRDSDKLFYLFWCLHFSPLLRNKSHLYPQPATHSGTKRVISLASTPAGINFRFFSFLFSQVELTNPFFPASSLTAHQKCLVKLGFLHEIKSCIPVILT